MVGCTGFSIANFKKSHDRSSVFFFSNYYLMHTKKVLIVNYSFLNMDPVIIGN